MTVTSNPFPENLFNGNRWLGVAVGTDAEMTPRQQLASTAFAMRAEIADSAADGVITETMLADDTVTTEKIVDGTVTAAKMAGGFFPNLDADKLDGHDTVYYATAATVTALQSQVDTFAVLLADTSDESKGDALIGFKQPYPNATSRTVHEKLSEILSVKDFGAVGDGSVLDNEAIEDADQHGPAVFPSGTYLINDIVLRNPPIFQGKVTFLIRDGASNGLTFQGDSSGNMEVQGGFFIDGQSDTTPCVLLTIQGRNWVIPKVHIYGNGKGQGDTGLRFTNYAASNVACTHNHIGFLMIKGVNDAVKWDCDDWTVVDRSYAANNVIEHAYLLSSTNHWHYNYTVTDVTENKKRQQYFKNRLHHGYFENSDVGFRFTGNANAGNVIGVS